MDAVRSTLIYVNLRLSTLYTYYHGISSRVSTSINFPEVLSRVAKSMRSMILSALSPFEVSGKSIPAPVAAAIPISVETKLCEEKQMLALFPILVEVLCSPDETYPGWIAKVVSTSFETCKVLYSGLAVGPIDVDIMWTYCVNQFRAAFDMP